MAQTKEQAFNCAEATNFLKKRWTETLTELNDRKLDADARPKEHQHVVEGSGWGQSNRLHLQVSVGNFMKELSDALKASSNKPAKKTTSHK
mmetsp:Transcript_740/g.1718  ORF Transcript_740/g.1718 Transcript_740/m.1718 type:complete len:91 (+) Transcript_740:242-514(+)